MSECPKMTIETLETLPKIAFPQFANSVDDRTPYLSKVLVAIDANVEDYEMLASGVMDGVHVVILERDRDGIEQLTQAIHQYNDLDQLHIIAHGASGCLYLGNSRLSLLTLDKYTLHLTSWFFSRHSSPQSIYLYGCNVAAGNAGAKFLQQLHHLTDANIAASTTPVGSAAKGGNWELDWAIGQAKSSLVFQTIALAAYPHILNTPPSVEWRQQINDSRFYFGSGNFEIAVTPAGEFYIGGKYRYAPWPETDDLFVAQYNQRGNLQWLQKGGYDLDYIGDRNRFRITSDGFGNAYIADSLRRLDEDFDVVVQKFSPSGTVLGERRVRLPDDQELGNITTDVNGNLYVVGWTQSVYVPFVSKFDINGALQWTLQLTKEIDLGKYNLHVAADDTGNIYLTSQIANREASSDIWLAKYNANGDLQWEQEISGRSSEHSSGITLDLQGNVYLTGTTGGLNETYPAVSEDGWVAKFAPNGQRLWLQQFGTPEYESVEDIAIDAQGNVYIPGRTLGSLGAPIQGTNGNTFVIKYDSNGNQVWVWQDGSSLGGNGVAVDANGGVYVTAYPRLVIKLAQSATPTLQFQDAVVAVPTGADQEASIQFDIDLSGASEPVILQYFTLDGTALAKDFNGISSDSRQTLVAQPGANNHLAIQVYGDKPLNHPTLETFARDVAYRDELQKGQKVNKFPDSPDYGDLGYRVDAVFDGPNTNFQAVGLTADEVFFTILTDPTQKVLKVDPNQGQRLLQEVRGILGENFLLDPVWQQAVNSVAQLEQEGIAWTFAKGTIQDKGKPPVLATRGTEPGQFRDIYEDTDPRGIGFEQFSANRDRIRAWLDRVNSPNTKPWITGHSLGGALAQWIASDYTSTGGQLGEIVTFNAPGISFQGASQFVRSNTTGGVTHYVTSGDWVSLAGQAFLPGRYILSDFNASWLGDTHLLPVLVPQVAPGRNRSPETFVRISDIVDTPGGLNDPDFDYSPDPNFFVQQLAASAINPRLSAILSRRDLVEEFRADIGQLADSVLFLNELAKPIYESAYKAATAWKYEAWNAIRGLSAEGWIALSQQTSDFWNTTVGWTATQWNAFQSIPAELWDSFTGAIDGLIDLILSLPTSVQQQFIQLIGDANQDGISDSQQANVASLIPDANNVQAFLTLVSPTSTSLNDLQTAPLSTLPADTQLPLGALSFDVYTNPAAASPLRIASAEFGTLNVTTTVVEILLQSAAQSTSYNRYWMYGAEPGNTTPHWYDFTFNGTTGAELLDTDTDGDIDKIKLYLVDGGRGDRDLTVNGQIGVLGAIGITSNPDLSGKGGQKTFVVNQGETVTITDFGGVGIGVNPSAATIAEADTIQFKGADLTARNLLLTQSGSDLEITFAGVVNAKVLLKNFTLENLDNLLRATRSSVDLGNILFDGQTLIQDSFDVFNADSTQQQVWNRNTVTFLNDLNNWVKGFDRSDDVINGQGGKDSLDGLSGNDLLRGGTENDILNGGAGDDIVVGGLGQDYFVFDSGKNFVASDLGIDTITDFEVGTDKIVLGSKTFKKLKSTIGSQLTAKDDFAIINERNNSSVGSLPAKVVYNQATGELFYNENGIGAGLGGGGKFASLTSTPVLSANDFIVQ